MAKLYVVGIGPGGVEHMTMRCVEVLQQAEVIVGYTGYMAYLEALDLSGVELVATGMGKELDRCAMAVDYARSGKVTAVISTGDAGLYGMAGPILAMGSDLDIEVVPGVTAGFAAAAVLGAPVMHDYCAISLSDLLTPWEVILKRVVAAAEADFVIQLYNPRSKGRPEHLSEVLALLLEKRSKDTPVGIVRHAGRGGEWSETTTLGALDVEKVDMMSMVIIGNTTTSFLEGRMVTPRGYQLP